MRTGAMRTMPRSMRACLANILISEVSK
jgi:hypothetical protein